MATITQDMKYKQLGALTWLSVRMQGRRLSRREGPASIRILSISRSLLFLEMNWPAEIASIRI